MEITLEPATVAHLTALIDGSEAFERAFGWNVAEGYLEFPEALPPTREALERGEASPPWTTYLIFAPTERALVGMAGFKGGPDIDGAVEIGYGIARAYRGRGLATVVARRLVALAFSAPAVTRVRAHTLDPENASSRVLVKCGFQKTESVADPDDGLVWRWEIARPA